MLVIRLKRTGRRGHAQFRIVVQDKRFSPKSGRVVAYLGSYDPHAKTVQLDKEKAAEYLKNGAQPSERIAGLLKKEGVKLPTWVAKPAKKKGSIKHPEKLRKNRPAGEPAPEPAPEAETAETPEAEEEAAQEPAEAPEQQPKEPEAPPQENAEEPKAQEPAEEAKPES